MKKIWAHKALSFKEASDFEDKLYMGASPEARLSDIQFCREQYFKMKGFPNEGGKRLRRVIRVVQ
jgi:hypothetical protein